MSVLITVSYPITAEDIPSNQSKMTSENISLQVSAISFLEPNPHYQIDVVPKLPEGHIPNVSYKRPFLISTMKELSFGLDELSIKYKVSGECCLWFDCEALCKNSVVKFIVRIYDSEDRSYLVDFSQTNGDEDDFDQLMINLSHELKIQFNKKIV